MIDRLELMADLNISRCWCADCFWVKADRIADALERGDLRAICDGDQTVGLMITPQGKSNMPLVLPWGT